MKAKLRLVLIFICAAGLTSCGLTSGDPSPQEKRNNFDKCVLDYKADNYNGSSTHNAGIDANAPFKCRHHLG